jgi:excisionase family DNA binding protein
MREVASAPSDDNNHEAPTKYHTVEDVAETLKVSVTWIYERTRKNAIPHHRFGKHIRFTDADLKAIEASGGLLPRDTATGRVSQTQNGTNGTVSRMMEE